MTGGPPRLAAIPPISLRPRCACTHPHSGHDLDRKTKPGATPVAITHDVGPKRLTHIDYCPCTAYTPSEDS